MLRQTILSLEVNTFLVQRLSCGRWKKTALLSSLCRFVYGHSMRFNIMLTKIFDCAGKSTLFNA